MNRLDKLLDSYTPPPVPDGLARRAAAAALATPQNAGPAAIARRRDRRGGWRRNLIIGGTAVSLAFTSAVATTYASRGRIEIPVVTSVLAAVPGIPQPAEVGKPAKVAKRQTARPKAAVAAVAETATPKAEVPINSELRPEWADRYRRAKELVERRREAGIPTPRADRIEATAKAIVERREAAGLPTPPIEQVELSIAKREVRRERQQRALAAALTDDQVRRFVNRLPPDRRERFLQLDPRMQRQLIARQLLRLRARRALAQLGAEATPQRP